MNIIMLQGRIPFEPQHYPGEGDKKSFANFTFALSTGTKNADGYYEEDHIRCVTSGGWADNLKKNWNNRAQVTVEGKLFVSKDYTDKDGNLVKGTPQLRVLKIHEYNTLDKTIMRAKIPNFENVISYTKGEGDKKSFARVKLAVSTGVKNEEGFYKERIITAKMFGQTADFFNSYYKAGDFITVEGTYADGQDYEKDGQMIKAMPELIVSNVHGFPAKKDGNASAPKKSTAPAGIGNKPAPGGFPTPGGAPGLKKPSAPSMPGKGLGGPSKLPGLNGLKK